MKDQDLRRAGLKVTGPRVKVLAILESHRDEHLSAEAVYRYLVEQGDDVGLATVYRVLTQFESAGIIKRHHFEGDHAVFELDEGEHHDHMVCVKCGVVQEFVDDVIEARQEQIVKTHGFMMTDHNLTIYGICQACQGDAIAI